MEFIRLISALAATTLAGYSVLRVILRAEEGPFAERLALSYGIGMGVISLQYLLYYFLSIKPVIFSILLPWVIVLLIVIASERKRAKQSHQRHCEAGEASRSNLGLDCFVASLLAMTKTKLRPPRSARRPHNDGALSPMEMALCGGLGVEIFLSFFRSLIRPLSSYDSIAIYAVRAKAVFLAGGIPQDFFERITQSFPNSSYPLMLPISEAWIYAFLGSVGDLAVKIIFPLFFLAMLTVFFYAVREFFGRKEALIFTFILGTIPQLAKFSTVGYADLILTFYFTSSFIYLFKWMRKAETRHLALSGLLMGLALWTKTEGWAFFLSAVLILALFCAKAFRKDRRIFVKAAVFILIALMTGLPWVFTVKNAGLRNEAYDLSSLSVSSFFGSLMNFERCPRIAYEFQKQFFGPKKWNILWIVFLALFFLNIKAVFREDLLYPTLLLMLVMTGYAYSYLLMSLKEGEPINWYIGSSLSRLFIHFAPLTVYWIARVSKKKEYI